MKFSAASEIITNVKMNKSKKSKKSEWSKRSRNSEKSTIRNLTYHKLKNANGAMSSSRFNS